MSASLSITDQLLAPLTFNRENLHNIGNDDDATTTALIIVLINSIISGLSVFTTQQASIPGLETITGGQEIATGALFIIAFVFQLLILLLISFFIKIVGGWFGASGTNTMQVFRMIGFASLWSTISAIIGLIVALGALNFVFTILFLAAFSVGYSATTGITTLNALFAAIIGYILTFIVLGVVFFILFLLFLGALFAVS